MININIFYRRPLFIVCSVFILSVVLGYFLSPYLSLPILIAILTVAAVMIVALVTFICFQKKLFYCACLWSAIIIALAIALMQSYFCFGNKIQRFEQYYDKDVTIEGYVVQSKSMQANYYTYEIKVQKVNGEELPHDAVLVCPYDSVLDAGFSFVAKVHGTEFQGRYNGFDYKLSRAADGFFISYESETSDTLFISGEDVFDIEIFFKDINRHLTRIFLSNTDEDTGSLVSAFLLGNTDMLSDEVTRSFTRTGTSHILALSGTHMTILMGSMMFLLKKVRMNHKLIAVLLSFCALFYLFLTGFSISATRAVIMLLVVYLSILLDANADALTSLGVAGALILFFSPYSVFDVGFWMSFAATLGLLVYMPYWNTFVKERLASSNRRKGIFYKVVYKILTAFVACIFSMIPLMLVMCIFIREISIYTVLATVVLSLPSSVLLACSALYLPLFSIPICERILGFFLRNLTRFMIDYSADLAEHENAVLSLNYPFISLFAFLLGAALLFSLAAKCKYLVTSLIPFGICVVALTAMIIGYDTALSETVKTTYLNVSSDSEMIVVSNNKEVVIMDVGNGSRKSYDLALEEAYEARATEIKAIMLTKYSYKHNATLTRVFRSERVHELWLPYPKDRNEYYKLVPLVESARRWGVKIYIYDDCESMTMFDFVSATVSRDYIDRSAVPISYVAIEGRKDSFVYISPAFNEGEIAPDMARILSKCDYLVFGKRGPKTKTLYTLPNDCKPQIIVFADNMRAAYFEPGELYGITYSKAEESCDIYFDK